MGDQPRRIGRPVLAVGVDDQDEGAGRLPDAGLDRGAVAFVVRMADDARAGRRGALRRLVRRSIVDDENFAPVAAARSPLTSGPIEAASLKAGMTTDVELGNRVIG